ncbi:MAG TPA: hypothetical protein PK970_09910 [Hyphomicrobiaceae bacterium]|nr:hypothetical protein [Hyphomicrobiaceae bacterium]
MRFKPFNMFLAIAGLLLAPALPPGAYVLNYAGALLAEFRFFQPAALIFRVVGIYGDATAANNLAVLCASREISCSSATAVRATLEQARNRGVQAAAYNLVWLSTSALNRSGSQSQADLEKLKAVAQSGDVHAQALYGFRALNSVSKSNDDSNPDGLEYLKRAAASGDTDYRYLLASHWSGEFHSNKSIDPDDLRRALAEFAAVDAGGDARGAYAVATILEGLKANGSVATISEELDRLSEVDWFRRSVRDKKHVLHKCGLGKSLVRLAENQRQETRVHLMGEAGPHLEACVAERDWRRPVRVFGKPALRLAKLGVSGLTPEVTAAQALSAASTLATLFETGDSMPRNDEKARYYRQRAGLGR